MNISLNYIKDKLREIIGEIKDIEPIGNHELKRHLVYKVSTKSNKYVLKLYYKKNRWNREISALKVLEDTPVNVPKIIDYGVLDNGTEYLIYKYIDGILLKDIENLIPKENLKFLYKEMGLQLSLIHNNIFEFFGSVDENLNSIDEFITYRQYFEGIIERILKELYSQEHDDVELFKKAEERLKSMYELLDEVEIPVLCHNDFSSRNILVRKVDDKYILSAIIDFEQSAAGDVDRELIDIYYKLYEQNKDFAKWFKSGYEQYGKINIEKLEKKREFYNLKSGIDICSWSKDVAHDYYLQGIKTLQETLERGI